MTTKRMTLSRSKAASIGYFLAFIACIPLANWMIGNVGTHCAPPHGPCLVPVAPWGPGGQPLMAPSGVLMIGLALGKYVGVAMFAAFALSTVFSMGLLVAKGFGGRKATFPFGPFLALGAMVAILWGPQLWAAWYIG